ncbi:hypothetical protein Cloev_0645 [Cloacibacillus evryensis DSM 19522]|nr:hypothetical protein Cloev_0645 [Cloacibacillus evryensis DSM 19522]
MIRNIINFICDGDKARTNKMCRILRKIVTARALNRLYNLAN